MFESLSIPGLIISICSAAGIAILLIVFKKQIFGYWADSYPDEILLVIKKGRLIDSGIGTRFRICPLSGILSGLISRLGELAEKK